MWHTHLDEQAFCAKADQIIEAIARHEALDGVVLSVRQSAPITLSPVEAYAVLRGINPSTYMFLVHTSGFSVWGATSLTLLRGQNRHVVAETDGGTHKVLPGEPAWVPGEKEMSEYEAVVEGLVADLNDLLEPETMQFTAEREVRRFANLEHIFAEIEGDLAPEVESLDAIARLSPHGATIGYPRTDAAAMIEVIETLPRGPFGGTVAFFGDDGCFEVAAVIRSMWQTADGIAFQAGAKIVAKSESLSEYQECLAKLEPLRACAAQAASSSGKDTSGGPKSARFQMEKGREAVE